MYSLIVFLFLFTNTYSSIIVCLCLRGVQLCLYTKVRFILRFSILFVQTHLTKLDFKSTTRLNEGFCFLFFPPKGDGLILF